MLAIAAAGTSYFISNTNPNAIVRKKKKKEKGKVEQIIKMVLKQILPHNKNTIISNYISDICR